MSRTSRVHALARSLARLLPGVESLLPHRPLASASASNDAVLPARISLLSVVRETGGKRYMAVEEIEGEWADCAWIESGLRRTGRFRIASLEVVPALGVDDHLWRQAFRAARHQKVG